MGGAGGLQGSGGFPVYDAGVEPFDGPGFDDANIVDAASGAEGAPSL
jgi:hypothetical protein